MKIRKYIPDGHLVLMIDTKTGFGFDVWNDFVGIEFKETGIVDINNNLLFVGDIVKDSIGDYYVIEESVSKVAFVLRNIVYKDDDMKILPRKNHIFQLIGQIYLPESIPVELQKYIPEFKINDKDE